ncbi:MAG: nuclear transport factor 2 family protein [Conexibacter sp.]|nr:nuclear transport factor 2 family protein [Conexibacter sp.]
MPLALEDRAAIHDLYAAYAHTFDRADADGWAALFTSDGVFAPPGLDPLVGTEALHGFVAGRSDDLPGMRHLMTNVLVEEAPGGARGSAYFLCFRLGGDGAFRLRNFGRYDDAFRVEDGVWKIADRQIVAELPVDLVDLPFAFA